MIDPPVSRLLLPTLLVLALVALSAAPSTLDGSSSATAERRQGAQQRPPRDRRPVVGADEAVLLLTPTRRTIEPGDRLRLALTALGLRGLSRLPVTVVYDPQVLRFEGAEAGALWRSGRQPVLLADGSHAGRIVIGVARLGPDTAPIEGRGVLVDLTFEAIAGGESEVRLERFALLDADGRAQSSRARTAVITVR